MSAKIVLVVDDDVKTVELVKLYLNRDGYKVLVAHDGTSALRIARESHPDLIVLDIMLPYVDGLEICRTLRAESDVPIVMLTALTTEQDKLRGLDIGADDYITKPFSPRELAARVRTVLRRLPHEQYQRGPAEITRGKLVLNLHSREASLNGVPLSLTPIEYKLLVIFAKEPGVIFSRARLVERAMGYDFEGFDRTIDVHVFNLRRKLERDPDNPQYIITVYGAGYKFVDNS